MKTTHLLIAPALLCTTMLAGCYTPYGAEPDRIPVAAHPKIVTIGWLSHDFFEFDAPAIKPEVGNQPMKITVSVRLKEWQWEKPIQCQYRFIYFDKDRMPLDPDPAWQFRQIEPRVATYLQGSAPDIGAVDYQCEIRQVRQNERVR